ncbi:uncharacterized protein F5147DRAFT_779012 [Suillus discolor]|uniref:DUF6532 domain-containing protein n=1 Tax=Suillus discolor TaxID=1912936 RepID=A0A9P7EXS3_9AGAM|nr:uncharacterized protein F5147DRAFT_779012 [Suillus discolor]KAG2094409.1 hypothetical protein F5147DRAFT_779012 [Suillus discolor]
MPDSPKKKRTKWKAADNDLTGIKSKRSRAPDTDDSQNPRRSGCPGVGKGGRNTQLERLDTILDAPTQTSQPKGSHSLDPTFPINPVAPEPPRKSRRKRSKKNQPPHPYDISEQPVPNSTIPNATTPNATTPNATTPNTTIPNAKIPRPRPKKKTVTPPLSVETVSSQPIFLQREDGGRFGLSQPIVPPGTEPDLQVLNNSFVAAAKATCVASNASQCQLSVSASNTAGGHLATSGGPLPQTAVSRMASTTSADAHFYHNLDPALRPTGSQLRESGSSDSSEGDSSSDDGSEDEHIGWGTVGGRHSAHPGFSGEEQPPQPRVVSALPPDFEFQYSRDEDDQVAEKTLAVNGNSSDSNSSMDDRNSPEPEDVLKLHHKKNGHPRLPDPELLDLLQSAETNTGKSKANAQAVKGAAKSKEVEGPNATQLGWYGPRWRSFLEDAKGGCCAQQALENPFPKLVDDLPVSITESLSVSLIQWLKNGGQVEADVWPAHKPGMARLLYDDLATWCSDLKKIAIAITPSAYNLVPPATIPVQERTAWVENATTDLLDDSMFLCDGVDEFGKTKNFAHPGLHEGAILFLYTGSYHIARRRPDIFQKEIPLTCLALICTMFNCVFDGLVKNGNGKSFPKFTAKEYEPIYKAMLKLLQDVMDDPYHGPRLAQQLRAWAEAGWTESCKLDGIDPSKRRHLCIQLD